VTARRSKLSHALTMGALIVAGEAIFALPFVIPRVFRPTLLEVWNIDHTTLGAAFSAYGLVAMVSYGLGGPLADRFPTRVMMAVALLCTAAGGAVAASGPSGPTLGLLYAGWGASTILLFWAGMLRATREWGGADAQGRAYGLLDGGRGLVAALFGTLAVAAFAALGGGDEARQAQAFRGVVWGATGLTVLAAAGVWWFVPEPPPSERRRFRWADLGPLARRPTLWLQALIVVCAYVAYKGTDDVSQLVSDVLGASEVEAASVGTLAIWLRPVGAIGAGFLADRLGGWRTVAGGFALLLVADLAVVAGVASVLPVVLVGGLVATALAVYALRGVYFSLLAEGAVPVALTGTAVGLVSVIGYTPDVFFGPMMGVLLDRSPGAAGHRDLFAVLAAFAGAGLLASLAFGWFAGNAQAEADSRSMP